MLKEVQATENGLAVCRAIIISILVGIGGCSDGNPATQLKVEKSTYVCLQNPTVLCPAIKVTNTGEEVIEIQKYQINDGTVCTVRIYPSGAEMSPRTLRMGEYLQVIPVMLSPLDTCHIDIISVKIETDKGTETFSWK